MDKTTATLAGYAASLQWADLTPQAIHAARRCILDSVGCALGAFEEPGIVALRRMAGRVSAGQPATVLGTGLRTAVEQAAFVNGSMVRYLDFSDDYFGGNGRQAGPHPSDNIGSVLAVADALNLDGKALLLGTVLAYEACNQLVDHTLLHARGWDYTIFHAAASALATGRLLGLDVAGLANALGIAVVSNVSMWQTRSGELSEWKSLAGPHASRNGLVAAQLACEGIAGPPEAFEGKFGYMKQFDGRFTLPPLGGNGVPFKIERTYFKYMPVMYSAQLPIWAALELRKKVAIADIAQLVVHGYDYMLSTGAYTPERCNPTTRETADHSSPYLIGAALVDGAITEETFTPRRYRDPVILKLISNLVAVEDPACTADYPRHIRLRLEAKLRSGGSVVVDMADPRGHPENPMTDAELGDKFMGLVVPRLEEARARRLQDALWQLEALPQVADLMALARV